VLKLGDMGTFKEKGFADRQSAAATARKAELEKFRVRSAAIKPESAEEQFARLASKAARDVRATERADRDAETTQQATRDAPSEAERKAARDARYAARKARTRK